VVIARKIGVGSPIGTKYESYFVPNLKRPPPNPQNFVLIDVVLVLRKND